ncbi:MAG TPA: hypothetical protein VN133_02475 [Humibacter sp.]|nr:hypothetical protein [Humibacter sp.]
MTKTENTTTDTRAVLGVFGARAVESLRPLRYRSAGKSRTFGAIDCGAGHGAAAPACAFGAGAQ